MTLFSRKNAIANVLKMTSRAKNLTLRLVTGARKGHNLSIRPVRACLHKANCR